MGGAFSLKTCLIGCGVLLVALGLLMVYSSSAILGDVIYEDSFFFVKRSLFFLLLSAGTFYIGFRTDPFFYERHAYAIYGAVLVLLTLVLIPHIGSSAGGAARWIALGPLHIQAGEIAKFALVAYLAMSLAKKQDRMHIFRIGIVPHLIVPGVAMGLLIVEPDFGTTMMVAAVTFVMLFVGGAKVIYLLGGFLLAIPLVLHAVTSSPYRMERVKAFWDPWAHRQDSGYQVVQSLMSFGSGEWLGAGIGNGTAKLFFLPAARTDFILAVIGEELGFVGVMAVLACFMLIAYCGFRIALSQKSPFLLYLAVGITTMIVLQALVNTFVVMGLLPTKGITLPFVSYGGSSLLVSAFMMGVLLRLATMMENRA